MKRLLLLLPLVLSVGCSSLLDAFAPSANVSPEAWVPRADGGDGVPLDTSPQIVSRSLKPGDPVIVNMTVALRPQPRVEDVVDEEGNITLPILGEFKVFGMTTSDAERAIKQAYLEKSVYRDMTVNVICTAAQSQAQEYYSITGAIRRRGRYPLPHSMTLREAIIANGDVTDFATGKIEITRNGISQRFNYRRIRKGIDKDPQILNGDIIEVLQ